VNQKSVEEFIHTSREVRKILEKKSSIDCNEKIVPRLQFFALQSVAQNEGITVGELSKVLMMSSGSVAQLIERLIGKGWITKVVDVHDRRIFHLSLTSKGEKEILKMEKIFIKKMSSMLSLISEEDLKEIIEIQKRLLEQLKKRKDSKC
jgi:DNA-binding MarR family transcriptional regulator